MRGAFVLPVRPTASAKERQSAADAIRVAADQRDGFGNFAQVREREAALAPGRLRQAWMFTWNRDCPGRDVGPVTPEPLPGPLTLSAAREVYWLAGKSERMVSSMKLHVRFITAIGIGVGVLLYPAFAAHAARLLFSSGFEGGVGLAEPSGQWQAVVGRDSVTGATWPADLWGGKTSIQLLTGGGNTAEVIQNGIETVVGRDGRPTRALRLRVMRKMGDVTQSPLLLLPRQDPREFYISQWVRLPPNLGRILGPGGWAAVNPAWKSAGDFRIGSVIEVDGNGTPYWRMGWDTNANGNVPLEVLWTDTNRRVPVPQGEWFRIEFYTRRGDADGRAWVKVNGQTLFDHTGDNIGVNRAPINRIFLGTSYGNRPFDVLIDDIEIWDGVPSGSGAGAGLASSPRRSTN